MSTCNKIRKKHFKTKNGYLEYREYESTHTGNQSNHQTTAEVQRVDLFHSLTNNAGWQRHTWTWAPLDSAHPRRQRPMGTQRHTWTRAPLGSAHPSGQRHMGTQVPLGSALPSWQQEGPFPAPVYQRASCMCSLSQGWAFMISEFLFSHSVPAGGSGMSVSVISTQEFYFSKQTEGEQH